MRASQIAVPIFLAVILAGAVGIFSIPSKPLTADEQTLALAIAQCEKGDLIEMKDGSVRLVEQDAPLWAMTSPDRELPAITHVREQSWRTTARVLGQGAKRVVRAKESPTEDYAALAKRFFGAK